MIENWKEEIFNAVLDSSTLALALFNTDGNLLYANKAMKILFIGNPKESIINPSFEEMVLISEKTPFIGIITIGNNTSVNTSIYGKILRKADEMLITGNIDVIQLSRQNKIMARLNQEVNNLQRDLIKEKKTLEWTNSKLSTLHDEKNEIMGIAAHDLRNPIGTANSFADLLIENYSDSLSEEVLKFLNIIRERTDFSLNLLNDLLDKSTIESGKLVLKKKEEDYCLLVRNNVESNLIFAQKKNILIEIKTDLKGLRFEFDPIKISQVLSNLISNSIKYSKPSTRITIYIKADKKWVYTKISDQGLGIPDDEINQLFQPFHTTRNITTGGEKSTGLGLVIVKKVITQHQGELKVKSKPGVGTSFSFTLPLS